MEANLGLDLILTGQPDKVAPGLSLLESAARSGDSEALHNLGVVYEQGMTGIPKNLRRATKLYRRAAKLG